VDNEGLNDMTNHPPAATRVVQHRFAAVGAYLAGNGEPSGLSSGSTGRRATPERRVPTAAA